MVIPKLDKVFATHGIPLVVKADNGPPFNSDDFERYLNTLGIEREPSTPEWPQYNADVERFMQPLGKAVKTAHVEGRAWQQSYQKRISFLLTVMAARTVPIPPTIPHYATYHYTGPAFRITVLTQVLNLTQVMNIHYFG